MTLSYVAPSSGTNRSVYRSARSAISEGGGGGGGGGGGRGGGGGGRGSKCMEEEEEYEAEEEEKEEGVPIKFEQHMKRPCVRICEV